MADLLDGANLTWTYYSSAYSSAGQDKGGSLWTAPNALQAICVPDANFQNCTGTEWKNHVVINPPQVLSDLGTNGGTCDLKNVSWVIPTGPNSDHPGGSSTGGPDWVASIVNALGESRCTDTINGQSFTYWQDTAVVITWDDWGGFYDHEPPAILATLVQGAQHILGPFGIDCDLRRWGLKLAERGGRNAKKQAIIATARKLAVLLHHLWVSGEVYEPLHDSRRLTVAAAA